MVDDPEITRIEAERYGATTPIAIDPTRTVSEAFGMLATYGHGDRPSHSFALVDPDRTIRDVVHYAEMFVPAEQLLTSASRAVLPDLLRSGNTPATTPACGHGRSAIGTFASVSHPRWGGFWWCGVGRNVDVRRDNTH